MQTNRKTCLASAAVVQTLVNLNGGAPKIIFSQSLRLGTGSGRPRCPLWVRSGHQSIPAERPLTLVGYRPIDAAELKLAGHDRTSMAPGPPIGGWPLIRGLEIAGFAHSAWTCFRGAGQWHVLRHKCVQLERVTTRPQRWHLTVEVPPAEPNPMVASMTLKS